MTIHEAAEKAYVKFMAEILKNHHEDLVISFKIITTIIYYTDPRIPFSSYSTMDLLGAMEKRGLVTLREQSLKLLMPEDIVLKISPDKLEAFDEILAMIKNQISLKEKLIAEAKKLL